MATVPTGKLERELRRLYMQWVDQLPQHRDDLEAYTDKFRKDSIALIDRMGGNVARLGAMEGFPAPKEIDLSPHVGTIYDDLKQAAIKAGIGTGLNPTDVARALVRSGVDSSFKRLNRLARTETVSAYWKNQWDSTDGLDLVMLWGAENGPRTCDYCMSRDGLVVEDSNIRDHPNGRCTLIPTHPSRVDYIGTLRPDGTVYQDPKWGKGVPSSLEGRDARTMSPEEKEEAADIMFGTDRPAAAPRKASAPKARPAASSVAKPAPARKPAAEPQSVPSKIAKAKPQARKPSSEIEGKSAASMADKERIKAAEIMFGTGSPQHKAAIRRWGKK